VNSGRHRAGPEVAVGLVGLGRFGKLHANVLGSLPGVCLAAVCDAREATVAEVAECYGVPGRFTDYERLLDETRPDAVFLVTPEPAHAEMALAAIQRGIAVFLEKPLATCYEDGQRVAAAAEQAGVLLQVGHILRFDVHHAYLKREVAAGHFGRLISLRVKRNGSRAWFPDQGDRAHPIYEASIHDIDLLLWYTGSRCMRVYAAQQSVSGLRYPDACIALLRFQDGTLATVETTWFVPDAAPANVLTDAWHGTIDAALELVGTEQTAHFNLLESGLLIWGQRLSQQPEAAYWPDLHGRVTGALREEVNHFVECLRTGRTSSVTSIADAVEGLRIADAIIASAESGREVQLAV
jgi:predicted dehydrogenase